ncbi:BaiN/RdsA family NAD(P)/FAD-dependent oxidoreductase [Hellea balneolensis]|uniref:NAD(P)/FAD-dependent oxidoreductase n=1 Tax=Hellea balneolensis TaxID=287478 RepID=UPI0004000FF1|nr:NAD(P)/FAD-dependent oxidoreductase [Hellea balneolensis]
MPTTFDIIIIGAGAAGLMCGAVAGARGKSVLIIDHAKKAGEKIRISGGGRCNFTNIHCGPDNFISQNPHFAKSALSRYTPYDFIDLVERYKIDFHEKTKGQLFCDGRSQQIIDMLLAECDNAGNEIRLSTEVLGIEKFESGFVVTTNHQSLNVDKVVIACGGPSIPKMGASSYGYKVAEQFGLGIIKPKPALVPLTFTDGLKEPLKALAGVSTESRVYHPDASFDEALLFTHRGLSGPAILQISSYWNAGDAISVNLAPKTDILSALQEARLSAPRKSPKVWLSQYLPERLAEYVASHIKQLRLADMSDAALANLALMVNAWHVKPAGTEGFRTAEVTKGGVDTNELSSKTMEAKNVPGLYFIGEVVDVTGHLGGHNFQWAWASGTACGEAI